ncbi:unnamed protein product [Clonostachys chloroleuca]|uniref:Uncharacterized protein n=1 Tax=Clonostachys chloroleuca TaxID=1926264 RepID=A0AA35MAG3_9HYPO|nr:unnamed protein product [Clonostachys chloroleuca]
MEVFKKKSGSWAEDAILKTAVGVAAASKQAAKIVDGVDWQDVRTKIEGAASSAQESIEGAYQYTEDTFKENPKLFYTAAGVVVGAAAAPLVMPALLGTAGFSAIGPVAGSTAAAMQSAGCVGFSTLQSAGMGGYGVSVVTGTFTAVGATMGGVAGAAADRIIAAADKK